MLLLTGLPRQRTTREGDSEKYVCNHTLLYIEAWGGGVLNSDVTITSYPASALSETPYFLFSSINPTLSAGMTTNLLFKFYSIQTVKVKFYVSPPQLFTIWNLKLP